MISFTKEGNIRMTSKDLSISTKDVRKIVQRNKFQNKNMP